MLALDLEMAGFVLGPDVFLDVLPLLVGGLLFKGAAGAEIDALLDEVFICQGVFWRFTDVEPVNGEGKECS